jgi:hypothetical protein
MRNMFYIALLLLTFASCKDSNDTEEFDKKNNSSEKIIDSLELIIEGLMSSDYDKKVNELKKLPQYQNAIFFSSIETKEYLSILEKAKDKYKNITRYSMREEERNEKIDSIKSKVLVNYSELQIIFDTMQSTIPIANFSHLSGVRETNQKEYLCNEFIAEVYYNNNLRIMYAFGYYVDTDGYKQYSKIFFFKNDLVMKINEDSIYY